jgi:predicted aconitase with swiveling domain
MPARSSVDALDALAQAVEHLIAAAERSKRQESLSFWGEIEHARSCLAEARLDIRGRVLGGDAAA